ncbi:T9SS type A sorting domain-containing protein [Zhouia sp. PK063]|uniref:T9SS type A sorting domain-containing protein n=1 Tax=Zhouia sp. PK063 TaxID=3373602 RepID=UPI0037B77AF3
MYCVKVKYRSIFLTILLLFSFFYIKAQDYTLTPENLNSTNLNIIWGSQLNIQPGSTIYIPAGTYAAIRFYDLVGTEENPITIINYGGQVTIDAPSYSAISLQRCKYVRVTGSGDEQVPYGIKVQHTNAYSSGIYLENFTTDVEVDHIEINDTGFAGIMAKTDPYCDNPDTWRSSGFIMKNIKIHDNYIHDTGGEGIYLGFTGGYKIDSNRSCNSIPIFAHWLEDITIANNFIERTGLDGIQVNLARKNCVIANNIVQNYAIKSQSFQDFAMSIGGGVYQVYNNRIYNTDHKGKGLQFISADSGTKIYNNVVVTPNFHAFFIHQRHEFENHDEGVKVFNNTIIEPEYSGIFYNTTITSAVDAAKIGTQQDNVPSYFVNNLIYNPGSDYEGGNTWKQDAESYIDFNNKSTRNAMLPYTLTNVTTRDASILYFKEENSVDYYNINAVTSAVVDAGTNITSFGVSTDILGTDRPNGYGYDVGAYEYIFSASDYQKMKKIATIKNDENKLIVYPNPTTQNFAIKGNEVLGANVNIYSFSGQLLYNQPNYGGERIDVSHYAGGNYFVNITSQTINKTTQLVVNR